VVQTAQSTPLAMGARQFRHDDDDAENRKTLSIYYLNNFLKVKQLKVEQLKH